MKRKFSLTLPRSNPMKHSISLTQAVTVLAVVAMTLTTPGLIAQAQGATKRPIEDWLAEQGQGFGLSLDFPADYLAFTGRDPGDPNGEIDKLMVVDYAGIDAATVAAESEGSILIDTQNWGRVKEQTLEDGRTKVHVSLHTTDALTYVLDLNSGDTIFGADPLATAAGAEPGIGGAHLHVDYIVDRPVGGTMEDLMDVIFFGSGDLTFVSFEASAAGPLGDGSPGMASTAQIAPVSAAIRNGFKGGLADASPVEMIDVRAVGSASAVPEPSTLLLAGLGLMGPLSLARRRRGTS
jgi:hypothetical protein